ncbi:MAG: hypothetical protein ACM3RX_04800 [Methanococcaceae archaeon]
MRLFILYLTFGLIVLNFQIIHSQNKSIHNIEIPFILDHNRMIVEGEIQRLDGSWRSVRFWVDSGNPDFFISDILAKDLGIDLSGKKTSTDGSAQPIELISPPKIKLEGTEFILSHSKSSVLFQPRFLFNTMHIDANIPSTFLKQFHIVFDYPNNKLIIAQNGVLKSRGTPVPVLINTSTGIVQISTIIGKDSVSLALDNGASYSFISDDLFSKLKDQNPKWPFHKGALGCANMWGYWPPEEESWPILRISNFTSGNFDFKSVGVVGISGIGEWYSRKTQQPVRGFLGANLLKNYRVGIDYSNNTIYFENSSHPDYDDMTIVGLTLRLEDNGYYRIIGIADVDNKPFITGIQTGDLLIKVDGFDTYNKTMGNVIGRLRGKVGDTKKLIIEREGRQFEINAPVIKYL